MQIQRSWIPALLAALQECFRIAERALLLEKGLWEFASVAHCVAELIPILTTTAPPPAMRDFFGGSLVKNPPVMQEMQVQSLHGENPLEKELATHSSILAW